MSRPVLGALSLGTKQPGCDTTDLCLGLEVKKDWSCAITRKSGLVGGCNASYVPYSFFKIHFCYSRFELLQSLTDNGKDILYFEEEVGPFLLHWMPAVIGLARTKEFLSMLVNVIKFNAAYVDEDIILGLVQ
jgi:hypothetical protein